MRLFLKNASITLLLIFSNCTPTQDKVKIAYVGKETNHTFHKGLVNGVKKEMAKRDLHVDFFSAQNQKDLESQELIINKIINQKYSGVIICPNDSKKILSSVEQLEKAKIPYVFIDTAIDDNDETKSLKNNCGYVGTDNFSIGKDAFQLIHNQNAKSVLLIRGVPSHRSSSDREEGFLSEMRRITPNMKIDFITGDWNIDKAYNEIKKKFTKSRPHYDSIFSYNDHMAVGVARYYKEKNIVKPYIVGVDGSELGQKGLLEGDIDAILVQATELMGIKALDRLIICLDDKTRDPINIMTPSTLMKKSQALEQNEK